MEYVKKQGESIFDICLNATGSLQSLNAILDYNSFETWTPEIASGTAILIPDTITIQTNIKRELGVRPAVNGQTNDFESQLDDILNILNFDMKYFEDGYQFLFEDNKSYKFN